MSMSDYLFWGMFGLTLELVFTAVRKRDISLIGHTSLWMFPVYAIGLTHGLDFARETIESQFLRYLSYPIFIWSIEILIGVPAKLIGVRIWDYRYLPDKLHWNGIISFFHFPVWILFGIICENVKALM